jgi:hypothetical protein
LPLQSSSAVAGATRRGDTVVVEADRDHAGRKTLELRRRDAEGGRPMVTEQIRRHWPLRDALAYATDGVETVRVLMGTDNDPLLGVEGRRIRYEGDGFELDARGGWTTPTDCEPS